MVHASWLQFEAAAAAAAAGRFSHLAENLLDDFSASASLRHVTKLKPTSSNVPGPKLAMSMPFEVWKCRRLHVRTRGTLQSVEPVVHTG